MSRQFTADEQKRKRRFERALRSPCDTCGAGRGYSCVEEDAPQPYPNVMGMWLRAREPHDSRIR